MRHILYFTRKLHQYAGNILYVNLIAMMLIGLLEGVGILLLIPMLSFLGILQAAPAGHPLIEAISAPLKDMPQAMGLAIVLLIFIGVLIGQSIIQRNLSLRDIKIHTGFINHLRLELYDSILRSKWEFFIKRRKSDLVNSLTQELGMVTNGTNVFFKFMTSLVFTAVQIGIAFWLAPQITLFILGCGGLILWISRGFLKQARELGTQTRELARSYQAEITEHLHGIKDVKSNMLEPARLQWMRQWNEQITKERLGYFHLATSSQILYKASSALILALFLFVSVVAFQASATQLLLVIVIFARLWPQVTSIQSYLQQMISTIPAFKSLSLLKEESQQAQELIPVTSQEEIEPIGIQHQLECRNISFRYETNETTYALRNIQLAIPAKQMTAIVGPSGAGKSSLVDILMGLLQAEQGEILIDGTPLTKHNRLAYRRSISYVSQDPFLFNATVRDNLRLMDQTASDADLWEALSFAAADEFIRQLPDGLDTRIGDRGVRLSGGERQRLVLARAILRKPAILVLDEATSALDSDNENRIQLALEQLNGKMTMIIIAHRLSTIRRADQVVVLDKGEMIQHGTFQELSQSEGLFKSLLARQLPQGESA